MLTPFCVQLTCTSFILFFQVTISPRMLLSHLSGIRHYEKDAKKVKEDKEKAKRLLKPPVKEKEDEKSSDKPATEQNTKGKEATQAQKKKEFEHEEYYLKDNFENVTQALDLFKDDPLIFKPGKAHICLLNHSNMIHFQC